MSENLFASIAAPPHRKRARKIRGEIGPFETSCVTFSAGERRIEISRITPAAIYYRISGRRGEMMLPHSVAYLRATGIAAGFDPCPRPGPRAGAIRRGVVS